MNADEKKKKIIMLFIALGLILSVIFGVTFSYLAPSINNVESNSTVAFNAGTIAINYENGQNQINASEVLPGWTSIKEFSLTAINNTTISTSGAMNYAIKLIVEKNTFNDGTITYSIEGENVDNNGTVAYVLPNSLKKGASEVILGYGVFDTSSDISKGVTHKYTLTIAFPNKVNESQNNEMGKQLSAYVVVERSGELVNLTIIDELNNINKTTKLEKNSEFKLTSLPSSGINFFNGWEVVSGNATIKDLKLVANDGNVTIKSKYIFKPDKTYTFEYTGNVQTFIPEKTDIYLLEVWGAQGGGSGNTGYGGYSSAYINLNKDDILYVAVGGKGEGVSVGGTKGGYNGGGSGSGTSHNDGTTYEGSGGGGATHIARTGGLLSSVKSNPSNLLIAAGGGGGAVYIWEGYVYGGAGGGFEGVSTAGTGGTQTSNGSNGSSDWGQNAGGGGGYYNGGSGGYGGGGGSGYIGNSLLLYKAMYCYNCTESSAETTKTISTTCHSSTPTENCAKEGNGYAKISAIKVNKEKVLSTITVVSEELKKVITIEAEKGEETEISLAGLTNSSLGFKSFEIEKGEATINKTKITPLSNTIVVRIIYKQIFNWEFAYTGNDEKFVAPVNGIYKIELWGASPNNDYNSYTKANAAYGGYTAGNIELKQGDTLYVYVGGSGTTFNCCTSQGNSTKSGGATDVRLINGEWNNATSLNSRIMVAGGAGGAYTDSSAPGGGAAGGLTSYSVSHSSHPVAASTQVSGGKAGYNGTAGGFGYGGTNSNSRYNSGAGGYYGGGSGPAGGGGSSYISGHTGCVAIISASSTAARTGTNGASCSTGTSDNLCSIHYSNKVFTDTVMIDGVGKSWTNVVGGLQLMPNYSGGTNASGKGNSGNGYARIKLIS